MKEESVRIHMYRIQNKNAIFRIKNKNDIGKTVIKEKHGSAINLNQVSLIYY